jgi:hypothetical protein
MNAYDTNIALAASNDVCAPARPAGSTDNGRPAAGGTALLVADWLGLAAAPTFAVMALLTGAAGDAPADVLCAAARGASPLGGMAAMYLLMSAVHLAPWLKLVPMRRNGTARGPRSGL